MSANRDFFKSDNQVHQNLLWEQTVKREMSAVRPNTEFHVTAASMRDAFVAKVNEWNPYEASTQGIKVEDTQVEEVLRQHEKPPSEKYKFPQTESQEIGWDVRPLVPPNPRFYRPLASSDVTRFSEYERQISGPQ